MFFAILARLLPTKSVDAIVADLQKLAAKLAAAEAAQTQKANDLLAASAAARIEAERAGRVAKNITDLTA